MGEKQTKPFQLSFNGSLKVDFQGSHVTSDGGLILVRELDERLGLGELIDEHLSDSRQGTNKQFTFADLLRQSVYSRLAGYEDLNDAERVSADPTFRLIGSKKLWDRGAALTSRLHSFETELLASEENLLGLMAVNRELLSQAEGSDNSDRVVLDMDSTESPVHGQQEGSAYNGHFESICYHPLLLFNQHGDCLAAKLRPGNVSSAEDWDELLVPEIERQQGAGKRLTFRADAAFAKPEIYEALEDRGVDYVIRIPANKKLEWEIADILFRPPGRPSAKPLVRYKPGFPFWPSWSVYDSRLPAAMQRFSHCCQVRYSFRCRSGLRMLADHGVPAKPEGPLATPLPRRPSATRVRWLFRAVDVTLRAQVAPKSAAACRRTTSGSEAPPQAATNNIARASRAVRPSSSVDAASSSATSF